MAEQTPVLEYKCPCCNAGLVFGQDEQKLKCNFCDNTFDPDAIEALYQSSEASQEAFQWEHSRQENWTDEDQSHLQVYSCPACGGQLLSDEQTAATFCPYCDNPAILPERLSGGFKPDALIPFKTGKEDAKKAFLSLCKGKPLLPKDFASQHRVEKITGIYVPFWLYQCSGKQDGKYRATRVHHWSDSRYHYTKTDYYLLNRGVSADFIGIPMDGSSKMENAIMESIEPYDYSQMVSFTPAFLTGFFADKYDVDAQQGEDRIRQRVGATLDEKAGATCLGYASVIPTSKQLSIHHSKARYVLLPVWMLSSKYKEKTYIFAMNGQTGKMTGTFPVCKKRSIAWFIGICAFVTALTSLIQWLAL